MALLNEFENLTENQCQNLVYNMFDSPFISKLSIDSFRFLYQKIYFKMFIQKNFYQSVNALLYGLDDRNNNVYKKRLTATVASVILDNRTSIKRIFKRDYFVEDKRSSPSITESMANSEKLYELAALHKFKQVTHYDIRRGRDLINPKFPFLCAATDGFIIENGKVAALIEVKTPQLTRRMTISEYKATDNFNKNFEFIGLNRYRLRNTSDYYAQIQFQLLISNLNLGFLVIYSPHKAPNTGILIVEVPRDNEYFDFCLPILENKFKVLFDYITHHDRII